MKDTNYKDMIIKKGKKSVWFLGANGKFKRGYDPVFTIYEMGNLVGTAPTLNEAKEKIDKIREEENND